MNIGLPFAWSYMTHMLWDVMFNKKAISSYHGSFMGPVIPPVMHQFPRHNSSISSLNTALVKNKQPINALSQITETAGGIAICGSDMHLPNAFLPFSTNPSLRITVLNLKQL
jgi:hypothetical protein